MNAHYFLSPLAEQDIDETVTYLAKENPEAAHRFVDALYASFDTLTTHPLIGHLREDLTAQPVRFWPFK